mmetsp:Transcript_21836/g.54902  ORF Transcript_21836/g.54902 Transcript_21836/m.54902 type:complete len:604 (+) Transcript_21836:125-1936(+)|eukprot:CAMPEP_0177649290 /NCGR_PEP_ID=MMETSP0447-20121125/11301_1 /TAXON_ID=0 /ORGANISM="Stygamoeba regulata, Strain BSH-02190019" /LENGTH=603 /DNA_ID=CAMNT_0019152025 /DNA_START=379 /DNA_END=2190 /DNA_ORIENTATION=+
MASKKTFMHEDGLPRLPIPPLDSTLSLFLRSLQALATPEEYEEVVKLAIDFKAEGGFGQELQKRLRQRDEEIKAVNPKSHWLEQWWLDKAYLEWREPTLINVNWFMIHDAGHPLNQPVDPLKRAACVLYHTGEIMRALRGEEIPPQYLGKQIPMCMDQYRRVFSTTRIPGETCDTLQVTPLSEAVNLVVLWNDHIFYFPIVDADNNLLTPSMLLSQFEKIEAQVRSLPPATPVPILTSENRTVWANARKMLRDYSVRNSANLDIIEKALLVVCFDDKIPNTLDEVGRFTFHNDNGRNRWYDKSVCMCFYANGAMGTNGEHSPTDATQPGHLFNYVFDRETVDEYNMLHRHRSVPGLRHPLLLQWDLPDQLAPVIDDALEHAQELINKVRVTLLNFTSFGSDLLKKGKTSPDGFVQLAIQLAHYRLHQKFVSTYESATTRIFSHGRTDTNRSCSLESIAFCKAYDNIAVNEAERLRLFSEAIKSHSSFMKAATFGKGCDRHLMGLRLSLREGEDYPDLFLHPAVMRMFSFPLSTSNISPSNYYAGGFGPSCTDGYGICYIIRKNSIIMSITNFTTSRYTDVCKMRMQLANALNDMQRMVTHSSL